METSKEFLKNRGLKNPPIDSGISGGGDAPRIYVSDIMKECTLKVALEVKAKCLEAGYVAGINQTNIEYINLEDFIK